MSNFPAEGTWIVRGSGTVATANRPVAAGKTQWVTHIAGGYDAAGTGVLTLLRDDGTTDGVVIAEWNVHDREVINLTRPLNIKPGDGVELRLSGASGRVVLMGFEV